MFKTLPAYASGDNRSIEWRPAGPNHWTRVRFRNVLREHDRRSSTGTEQLLRVSQYTGVTERKSIGGEADTRAASLVGYKRVAPGDLAVNIMLAWNGSLGVSRFDGIVSPAYCVYRFTSEIDPWYFHHLLRTPEYKARIKALSTGVVESRLRLYSDDLYGLEALVPPADEQAAIVKYLGHAHARIDRAIAAKRKLIALLEEQKQSIIHQAVTRGLDPTVPLKDSGVPWLGDIPSHWSVAPLKYLAKRKIPGVTPPSAERSYYEPAEVPWHGPSSLRDQLEMLAPVRRLAPAAFSAGVARAVAAPALVVTQIGACGKSALLTHNGSTNQQLTAFELDNTQVVPEFVARQFRLAEGSLRSQAATSTLAILSTAVVASTKIALPSRSEQVEISVTLHSLLLPANVAVQRAKEEIELLREFRTRLTSDVVTGQLDVREIAATLPEFTNDMLVNIGNDAGDSVEDIAEEFVEGESD